MEKIQFICDSQGAVKPLVKVILSWFQSLQIFKIERIFPYYGNLSPWSSVSCSSSSSMFLWWSTIDRSGQNNIYGTRNVAEAAKAAGVAKFVMISTDKAVNPPNVMGQLSVWRKWSWPVEMKKERLFSQRSALGMLLGSRGSVVPLFKEQIARGGPITVTDFRNDTLFHDEYRSQPLGDSGWSLDARGEVLSWIWASPWKFWTWLKRWSRSGAILKRRFQIQEAGIRPGEKALWRALVCQGKGQWSSLWKDFVGKCSVAAPR